MEGSGGGGKELVFERVRFAYDWGTPFALNDFTVGFSPGEVTALLGPNGSGKTTMMKLANRRLVPASGRVLSGGRPLAELTRREVGRSIGFVPQSERIAFDYSILDYVLMGRAPWLSPLAAPGRADAGIAAEAIEEVGLTSLIRRSVRTLSGGQVQLVLLARVLVQSTQVLLLDEASSALDLANKRRFLDIIRSLARRGKTILLSTHEPAVAEAVADRMVLMKGGLVQAAGPASEVFTEANLTSVYETPIRIFSVGERKVVLWT